MKNTLYVYLIKSWKTTIAGIYVATAAYLKAKGIIDSDTLLYLMSIGGAVGLVLSKDANATGGTPTA